MIKDTNPDHYKVDGANFIEYMNDPKISGFGNWMFANGFNSGVWASSNWISVKERLPEMHKSIFAPWYGRKEWTKAMWQEESDRVIVAIKFPDGSTSVGTARLHDGKWSTDIVGRTLNPEITHWMPLPEPPKEEKHND